MSPCARRPRLSIEARAPLIYGLPTSWVRASSKPAPTMSGMDFSKLSMKGREGLSRVGTQMTTLSFAVSFFVISSA
jgi:hypothetical protein